MPVEIKELIIRTTVVNAIQPSAEVERSEIDHQNNDAIIAACVNQVLKILERKKER